MAGRDVIKRQKPVNSFIVKLQNKLFKLFCSQFIPGMKLSCFCQRIWVTGWIGIRYPLSGLLVPSRTERRRRATGSKTGVYG